MNTTLNPTAGEHALAALEPVLRAIPLSTLMPPRLDPRDAAVASLALVDVAQKPERAARFALLPATVFAPDTVAQLERAAQAAWFCQTKLLSESAQASEARVDAAMYEASGVVLARMTKLLDYHVGHLPDVATELSDIRSGQGHQDRASDLVRVALLFERHRAELSGDTRLYRADDNEQARRYADLIVESLRAHLGRGAAAWQDLRDRAHNHMVALYNQVKRTGEFLFHDQPEHRDAFVSLRQTVAPNNAGRSRKDTASKAQASVGTGSD